MSSSDPKPPIDLLPKPLISSSSNYLDESTMDRSLELHKRAIEAQNDRNGPQRFVEKKGKPCLRSSLSKEYATALDAICRQYEIKMHQLEVESSNALQKSRSLVSSLELQLADSQQKQHLLQALNDQLKEIQSQSIQEEGSKRDSKVSSSSSAAHNQNQQQSSSSSSQRIVSSNEDDVHQLKREYEAKIQKLQTDFNSEKSQNLQQQKVTQELESTIAEQQNQIVEQSSHLSQMEAKKDEKISKLENQVSKLQSQIVALSVQDTKSNENSATNNNTELENRIQELETEVNQIQALKSQLQISQTELSEKSSLLSENGVTIQSLKRQVEEQEAQNLELKSQIGKLFSQAKQSIEYESQMNSKNQQIFELNAEIESLKYEITALKTENQNLRTSKKDEVIAEQNDHDFALIATFKQLEQEKTILNAEIERLTQLNSNNSKQVSALNEQFVSQNRTIEQQNQKIQRLEIELAEKTATEAILIEDLAQNEKKVKLASKSTDTASNTNSNNSSSHNNSSTAVSASTIPQEAKSSVLISKPTETESKQETETALSENPKSVKKSAFAFWKNQVAQTNTRKYGTK